MRRRHLVVLLGGVVLIAVSAISAHASGFAIMEQGVRGLGTAYAGAAAQAEDPSTIFYNPAGLVRLSGKQVEAGVHYIVGQSDYKDNGSTTVLGTPLTGDNDDGAEPGIVPNLYFSQQFSDGVVFGLGINAPFGLTTEYDRDWVGRYHAVETGLKTININPSMAARVDDKWSVGAGLSIEYADVVFSNMVDFGTIGQGPPFNGSLGGIPQGDDGFAKLEGDDWGYGFNIGFLYEPRQGTRFGLAFRSMIHHKLEGKVKYTHETATAQAIATTAGLVDGKISAPVDLPEILSLAGYHQINDKFAVVGDVTFSNWDRFKEIRISYASGQQDTVITTQWDDSWRFGLGFIYTPTKNCTGRLGIAFDETPIPSKEFRTPRVPGEDRLWIAVGAGYKFTNALELNLGYTHIFVDDPVIEKTATGEDRIRGALTGEYEASFDIFSINATYAF